MIANGVLVAARSGRAGPPTHWRAVEPMATYLAFFAAGAFETRSGSCHGTANVRRGVQAARRAFVRGECRHDLAERPREITAWLESVLGDYPFSTTGGVVTSLPVSVRAGEPDPADLPAGCRSQPVRSSCTSSPTSGSATRSRSSNWRDIWLNEGFAQFMEAVLRRDARRPARRRTWLSDTYDRYLPSDGFWQLCASTTPARHGCSTSRSTSAARWPCRRCATGSATPTSGTLLRTWVEQRRLRQRVGRGLPGARRVGQRRGPRRVLRRVAARSRRRRRTTAANGLG